MKGYKAYREWFKEYQWDMERNTRVEFTVFLSGWCSDMVDNLEYFLRVSGWEIESKELDTRFPSERAYVFVIIKQEKEAG